jgi:hypothetical protein
MILKSSSSRSASASALHRLGRILLEVQNLKATRMQGKVDINFIFTEWHVYDLLLHVTLSDSLKPKGTQHPNHAMPKGALHNVHSPLQRNVLLTSYPRNQNNHYPLKTFVDPLPLRTVSPDTHNAHREANPTHKRSDALDPSFSTHLHLHLLAVHTPLILILHHHIRF